MFLADVPIDLLSVITAYLHHLDVANLWLSGSSALNAKFANGGVSQLWFVFNSRLRRFSWPSLLYKLPRLTTLYVEDWDDSKLPSISPSLLSTWHTIKVLTLRCSGVFPALHSLLRADQGSFSALETLNLFIEEGEAPTQHTDVIWPQSLLSLVLHNNSSELVLDLCTLPPHLTSLEGDFSKIVNSKNTSFPASLTALQVGLTRVACDPVPWLPHGLKKLSLYSPDGMSETDPEEFDNWTKRSICHLPRGLTSLSWVLSQSRFSRDDLRAISESLPNLTSLNVGRVETVDFDVLPPLVKHYRVSGMTYVPITKDTCSPLARCLERVAVDLCVLPHLKPNANVQVLVTDANGSVDSFTKDLATLQLKQLSPYITWLTFESVVPSLPCEMLPTTLTTLTLNTGALTDEQLSKLPNTLTSLSFLAGEWIGENVEGWKRLPRSLQRLHLRSVPLLSVESSTWFPSTLRELKIVECKENPPTAWYTGLPASLRSLRLTLNFATSRDPATIPFPPNISDISLRITFPRDETEACKVMHMLVVSLPPLLDWLNVFSQPKLNIPFHASLLKLLPRRLSGLSLPRNDLLKDSDARLLPRSLLNHSFGARQLRGSSF